MQRSIEDALRTAKQGNLLRKGLQVRTYVSVLRRHVSIHVYGHHTCTHTDGGIDVCPSDPGLWVARCLQTGSETNAVPVYGGRQSHPALGEPVSRSHTSIGFLFGEPQGTCAAGATAAKHGW